MAAEEERAAAPTAKRAAVQACVLRATEELLAEGEPFADLNVERIAKGAGISRTAFYFYFRDKRELLMRLAEDVAAVLYSEADVWFSGAGDDPTEDMRVALTNIAEMYARHGALLRAIVEVSTYDDEVARFWRALLGRFVDATRPRIEAEQEAAGVTVPSAAATSFALVWMTERVLYEQRAQAAPISSQDMVDALLGIWVRTVYGDRAP